MSSFTAGLAASVRPGVVCTRTELRPSTTAVTASSTPTARNSCRRSPTARAVRTRFREYAATASTTASSPPFTSTSWPYPVSSRAPQVPTSTSAWTMPASTRQLTASAAQRDQTGRIAPSSVAFARRSRKPTSMTRPPSQTAMPATCAVSATTVTAGTGVAVGCPDSAQVASPATPNTASRAWSTVPPSPISTGRTRIAIASRTPNRITRATPNWLASTSRRSPPETSNTPPPVVYGACRYSPASVLSPISPRPVQTRRIGPVRDRRRGHSSASTRTGPTTRTSPAYPRYLPTGMAVLTTLSTAASVSAWGALADGAPIEKVNPPETGWLSAEMTR